jgi:hypothetical protein
MPHQATVTRLRKAKRREVDNLDVRFQVPESVQRMALSVKSVSNHRSDPGYIFQNPVAGTKMIDYLKESNNVFQALSEIPTPASIRK